MKLLAGILVLIVGFTLTPQAHAGDLILSRSVLEDPSGTLTIADVVGRAFTPVGPALPLDTRNTVHWICVHVQAPAHGSGVVFFIRPTYLNDMRLYEPGVGSPLTWKTRVTGNHYAYSARDRASITPGFAVDMTAPEATYYLRLKTRSPSWMDVEALEPAEAERKDHQRDLVLVFFVTAMLCLLVWAILNYLEDRQPVVGLFAVHQTVYTLFGIAATGYLAPWAPARFPQLGDGVGILTYCAINFTSVLFCRALFKPYEPPPKLMRGLDLLLFTFPLLLAAVAMGYDSQAVNTNAALIKITWLYLVVVAFSLRVERTPSRRVLQIFFVSILMNNVVFWLANRDIQIVSRINLSAIRVLVVDGLIIGGLFAMILHTRSRQMQREGQQSVLDLALVQKKLEIEQDLKERAEIEAQTDYLTGLVNRRRFVELAKRELARSIRFKRPLTMLMIDIDLFKIVNDTWGHSVGDAVLKEVAKLIRGTLRDEDILGRTGGEEFAAVIVESEGNDAFEVARRVCTTVAHAVIAPPGAGNIQVTVSIGPAQLGMRVIDFDNLLNEADRAMYKAKQAGGNRVTVA